MVLAFRSAVAATTARAGVTALVSGSWFPWPLGAQGNVCANLVSGSCPLTSGATATYRVNLRIPGQAPPNTRAVVQVRLVNQANQAITCTRISVLVQ